MQRYDISAPLGAALRGTPQRAHVRTALRAQLGQPLYAWDLGRAHSHSAALDLAQPTLCCALERTALSLDITQRLRRHELQKLWNVRVSEWPTWRTRREYVTYLGEVVTLNGEPIWVDVIDIIRDP